jgi:hypothetical protein
MRDEIYRVYSDVYKLFNNIIYFIYLFCNNLILGLRMILFRALNERENYVINYFY